MPLLASGTVGSAFALEKGGSLLFGGVGLGLPEEARGVASIIWGPLSTASCPQDNKSWHEWHREGLRGAPWPLSLRMEGVGKEEERRLGRHTHPGIHFLPPKESGWWFSSPPGEFLD